MPDDGLLRYIRDGLAAGQTEAVLRSALLQTGWQPNQIDEAFKLLLSDQITAQKKPSKIPLPRTSTDPPTVKIVHFARIAFYVGLIGPVSTLLWSIFVIKALTGPNTGLAALAAPFFLAAAYPVSLACGIIALIFINKAKRVAKESGLKSAMTSAANIIAVIDVIPLANAFILGVVASWLVYLTYPNSVKQQLNNEIQAEQYLTATANAACTITSPYTVSQFTPTSIAALDAYTGPLPYLNGTQTGVQITGKVVQNGDKAQADWINDSTSTPEFNDLAVTLQDDSGNLIGVILTYGNESMLDMGLGQHSETITVDGFFTERNGALPYPTGTTPGGLEIPPPQLSNLNAPIINTIGVCGRFTSESPIYPAQ
jgi:hypothetical protein